MELQELLEAINDNMVKVVYISDIDYEEVEVAKGWNNEVLKELESNNSDMLTDGIECVGIGIDKYDTFQYIKITLDR